MVLARGGSMVVEYDILGSGLEAVLLLPALGADRTMWNRQAPALVPAYTLIPCEIGGNLPAVGGTGSLGARADAVRAVLDALALERAHLVGVSMGGMVAQIVAATWPERVRSLGLISTASTYEPERRRQMRERADLVGRQGMAAIAGTTVERWLRPEFRAEDPAATETIRAMLLRADPSAYAAAARAVAEVETGDLLPQIEAPALVLTGERDVSLPPDASDRLVAGLRDVSQAVIPGAAHLCTVDAAAQVNDRLLAFLRRHASEDPEMDRLTPSRIW